MIRIASTWFAAILLTLGGLGSAQAETFGDWEAKQIKELYVAQTKAPSMALFVVCAPGHPDLITANLVTDLPVPAYRDLKGPVASFTFGDADRLQFAAIADEQSDAPDRVFKLAAGRAEVSKLVKKLRQASEVGVVVIGGPSFEEARLSRAEFSLSGSSKALGFIHRGCR